MPKLRLMFNRALIIDFSAMMVSVALESYVMLMLVARAMFAVWIPKVDLLFPASQWSRELFVVVQQELVEA